MNYIDKLQRGYEVSGSIICMGLDPVIEYLPGTKLNEKERVTGFFEQLFAEMKKKKILPGAFKPNLGFYHCLDRPRVGNFRGSEALAIILDVIELHFPDIPVILDYKRGDIQRSSENYAAEGFISWGCDAVTAAPYMGSDSVVPFLRLASKRDRGVYVLNRTSNRGAAELQNLIIEPEGIPLYKKTAKMILKWAEEFPGTGAVVGATSLPELEDLSGIYAGAGIPLLIPGVGGQGGNAADVTAVLKRNKYDLRIVRINSSSGITHPWAKEQKPCPGNWTEACLASLNKLNEDVRRGI